MVVRCPDLVTAAALMEVSTRDPASLWTFSTRVIRVLVEGNLKAFEVRADVHVLCALCRWKQKT